MKRTIKFLAGLALSALVFQTGFAQVTDPNANQNQTQNQNQTIDVPQQVQDDLTNRYSDLDQQGVTWSSTELGYNATYNMNDTDYMARYDAEGNWLETMERREWDDNVPEPVKMGLNNNAYENYQVDSYWEITESDADMPGYYFNLRDNDGNTRNLRMDSEGKIVDENDYNDPR